MPIRAVAFDVGETLVDETRHWGEWADWMGVTRLTFFAALGSVIERGGHHHAVFQLVQAGFDLDAARRAREATGWTYDFAPSDFYPDALPCLAALKAGGYRVGIAGNQPEAAEDALLAAGARADFVASSTRWGVEKPSPAFFARVAEAAGVSPAQIAYVGDRLDNDVLPARAAGMTAVFIRRGPWAIIQARSENLEQAHVCIESLSELVDILAQKDGH
ncbi:MAG TPA: HAD family hydrolase [Caulobacteraceae bacterium]|nr:HAD family hydrolase [Caulobacteraceae bacterium]